ncbi:MAG: protein kinase [Kofleriaceae bacterium]|nr:protein kinase [Kofleriaceae bacterium]
MNPTSRALIIEPDKERSQALADAISQLGVESDTVETAQDGWRCFAQNRHTHVFAALASEDSLFLRKLHSEFVGTLPVVFVTTAFPQTIEADSHLRPDAHIVWPLALQILKQILKKQPGSEDSTGQQIARLHDLCELTILGPDLGQSIDSMIVRMTLGFQATNGFMWGPESESFWPRTAHPVAPAAWPTLLRHCQTAARAQTTLLVSDGPTGDTISFGSGKSLMAVSVGPPGEDLQTGIGLVNTDGKRFSTECGNCLITLSRRLTQELAWVSAHNRLLAEHEQLRRTAHLDSMLEIWTLAAFQLEFAKTLASGHDPSLITIALFDFHHLRGINDRFGHSVGDAVLTHFTRELESQLDPQAQLGRFGGDELIVLFLRFTLEETTTAAKSITNYLASAPYVQGEVSIDLVIHSGVARLNDGEFDSEGVFTRVRLALDQAVKSSSAVAVVETNSELGDFALDSDNGLISLGSTLGGMYRILHEINRGAMGIVYRGEDLGLGRPVAIKVLRPDLSTDDELVDKFRSEAALLASIRHPNLVQVFSFGTENDAVYFVMELVEGEPVSQIARRWALEGEYINLHAVGTIIEEIADALDAIHALGIVHRDVKPENVLIDRINDRAVLVDVGIAKRVGDARDAAGTPGYAAPESFMAADETPLTDVYGLAATAYAMITGSAPYVSDDLDTLIRRQLTEPIAPPSQLRTDISTAVDQVLAKALHPTPQRRFHSANALAAALTRALAKAPTLRTDSQTTLPKAFTDSPTIGDIPIPTYQVPLIEPSSIEKPLSETRGAVFRVASKVLGSRLGADWLTAITRADPVVGELLKSTLPPRSWHSSEHFLWLLQCISDHTDEPESVARQIGATLMQSTLSRFYGAKLESQTSRSVLSAAQTYWSHYHNWGKLEVEAQEQTAQICVKQAPKGGMLNEMLAGMFGHIPMLVDAKSSHCRIAQDSSEGDPIFEVEWSTS